MGELSRAKFAGLEFYAQNKLQLLCELRHLLNQKIGFTVVTPNIDFLSKIERFPSLKHICEQADFILCDSQPIHYLAKMSGVKIPKISGSDLIDDVLKLGDELEIGVVFLGGNDHTEAIIRKIISHKYKRIKLVHVDSRTIDQNNQSEIDNLVGVLGNLNFQIVFLGYGFPKQEEISIGLKVRFPEVAYFCIGMGIQYFTNQMKRSPIIFTKLGIEWLWRLIIEPKRLFRRYIIYGIPMYIKLAVKELKK